MADSTDSKSKKTLDAFADDLDAMLNMDDASSQQVGSIDDDEAIDRLLVGDETFERDIQQEVDEFADIDSLLDASDLGAKSSLTDEIDEFGDDFAADIAISPGHEQQAVDDEFADLLDVEKWPESRELPDDVVIDDVAALERVGEIEDFAADEPLVDAGFAEPVRDELENMTEIDEFSDDAGVMGNSADFLMADFDISADENSEPVVSQSIDKIDELEALLPPDATPLLSDAELDSVLEQAAALQDSSSLDDDELLIETAETEMQPEPEPVQQVPQPPPVQVIDHSAEIAALNRNIVDLKKHQQQIRHDLTEVAGKAELTSCLETLDGLQTEQKKAKRAVDALVAKKPVAAYVANGLAATALLLGIGFGVQGMIAKSQLGEVVTIIGKLQEQVNAAPTSDAAEKEMLRKQLDELSVSTGVMSTQIAELGKAAQADAAAGKTNDEQARPASDLGNQLMQIGASIEALQNKVAALEKGRTVAAAPVAKPEKKKPEVVEENWAVNLIAFKQDWYAKRKAEEFVGKGVPAKVVKTESKGENWYRLFVDGFKSQYEAAAYAAKIKKSLNLDSVWVTRNKD